MSHSYSLRVYYEDTDLAGIVYYANYLKFIERARTEWVRSLGVDQARLKSEQGLVFAVRHVSADYLRPACFDDLLTVHTRISNLRGAQVTLAQDIFRDETCLFQSKVSLVALKDDGRPARLPDVFRGEL